jgi:hypothetical protein
MSKTELECQIYMPPCPYVKILYFSAEIWDILTDWLEGYLD